MADRPAIHVIAGPTASGKTQRAIEVARQAHGAVISADSRMVYRGLDIGAGKPTWEHRLLDRPPWIEPHSSPIGPVYTIDGVDHYLLDVALPEVPFSLTDWLGLARSAIAHIRATGHLPIVVGGTGLYLRALLAGYQPPPTNPQLRQAIAALSHQELLEAVSRVDPITADRERANRRRLIRALEVYRLTGQPLSRPRRRAGYAATVEVLRPDRTTLWSSIDNRVDDRLAAGLVAEVEHLRRTVSPDWLNSLGLEYRIINQWLADQGTDRVVLRSRLVREIRAYARRQQTFLTKYLTVKLD